MNLGMWFGKRQKIIRPEIETINMRHIYTIFFIVILIVVTSCHTIPQDTAVLSEQTQAIVNFFLEDTEKYLTDSKQLVIEGGYIENDSSCFYLILSYGTMIRLCINFMENTTAWCTTRGMIYHCMAIHGTTFFGYAIQSMKFLI